MKKCDNFFKVMKKNMAGVKGVMSTLETDIKSQAKSNETSCDALFQQIKEVSDW